MRPIPAGRGIVDAEHSEPTQKLQRKTSDYHSSLVVVCSALFLWNWPPFGRTVSPFIGIGPKRSHPPPIALADLPNIDAVLISHDHYDHLDMQTVRYLSSMGAHFLVPLGVGAHLDEWGVPKTPDHRIGLVGINGV